MRTKHNDLFQKRGLAFLVQMRRGGLAREEALRWFETVDREDGTLALGWLITVISGDFRDNLDEDERLQGARRAFARGLDTFVYVPGCKLANALSGHIKTCIKNELTTLVRSKSRKSQGAGDSEISERMTGKTVSEGFDRASSISELLGDGGQIIRCRVPREYGSVLGHARRLGSGAARASTPGEGYRRHVLRPAPCEGERTGFVDLRSVG
jgi:hypothetical protein